VTALASMSYGEYEGLDGVRWSRLKLMDTSPLHYATYAAPDDTDSLLLGRATHCAVFEPDEFFRRYVEWTGGTRSGDKWKDFKAANAGKEPLTPYQYSQACRIRDAVHAHPVAREFVTGGVSEQTVTWNDGATGIGCKARLDYLKPGILTDLKTTKSIDEFDFARTVVRYAYHGQLGGFYRMGVRAATGDECETVAIVAVERKPPFDAAVYVFDQQTIEVGEDLASRLLATLKQCQDSGEWPGRYPTPQKLLLPAWALPSEYDIESLGIDFSEGPS
jgi:hypothetical protein